MQKFGLDSISNQRQSALEFEIIKEQATALGIAGRKLQAALDKYRDRDGSPGEIEAQLLDEISQKAYELILQREFVGFIQGNLEWIQKHYDIPAAALSRLGVSS